MQAEDVVRLATRMRRRLERRRLAAAAARGTLWGGALGLLALLAGKALPALAAPDWIPWGVLLLGAAAGLTLAALRRGVTTADAALYLDHRLGTRERIVTVCTRRRDPLRAFVARGVAVPASLPQPPLPRETALLPAAFFLLFAAGLLPEASARPEKDSAAVAPALFSSGSETPWAEPAPQGDPTDVAAALQRGEPPSAAAASDLRRVVDRFVSRPEDRRRLHDLLDRAARGDGAATRELGEAVGRALQGGGGRGEAAAGPSGSGAAPAEARGSGAAAPFLYPDQEDLVRAYYRALAREGQR